MPDPTTIDGILDVAKGLLSIVGGGLTVTESAGIFYYVGVAEIAVGESEIAEGYSILSTSTAPDPTAGVNYGPDPNTTTTIDLPTVEIDTPGPTVITVPDVTIYGTPPAGVTPENIINLQTIEISDLPAGPSDGGAGDGGDGGDGGGGG